MAVRRSGTWRAEECLAALSGLLPRAWLHRLTRPADLTLLTPARLRRHVAVRTPLLLLLNDQLGFYYCLALINTVWG